MDNWYKKAQKRSRWTEPDTGQVIENIDMSVFDKTMFERAKEWLEKKYPTINWTVDKVYEWVNENFIGKPKPISEQGPKDRLHNI